MCTETSYTLRCEHVVIRTLYCSDAPPLNPRSRKERKACKKCIRNSVPWPPPPDFGAHIRCPLPKCPFEERGGYWNCCWCGKEWNEKGRNIGAITSAVRHAKLPPSVNNTSSRPVAFAVTRDAHIKERQVVRTGCRPASELGMEEVKASIHRAYHEGGQRQTRVLGLGLRERLRSSMEHGVACQFDGTGAPLAGKKKCDQQREKANSEVATIGPHVDWGYPRASSRGSSPEISFAEVRKTRTTRKGHSRNSGIKRSSTYDFSGGFSSVVEEDDPVATTSSSAAHGSRSSRKSTYDTSVDYLTKKAKTPSSKLGIYKKGYGAEDMLKQDNFLEQSARVGNL
ncbi:hypothetical protein CIB48_g9614 [Xylaria polymorpha]|nr:hypothetical protein CIB48_g9614 [Xylaria polymorpha]